MGMGDPFTEGYYEGDALLVGQAAREVGVGEEAAVMAGGPLLNPVEGPTCGGFLAAEPSASVTLDGTATFSATPADGDDLVLLVHTPDGRWLCGDDADGEPHLDELAGGEVAAVALGADAAA